MSVTLADSYAACREIVRRANSSFPLAFRLVSRPKRRAMDALYAFARITDDLADEPGEPAAKLATLDAWSKSLNLALAGIYSHPIHWALHDAVQRNGIPHDYLKLIIQGVASDVVPAPFPNFDALKAYCFRVASAVGLACVHIWGVKRGTFPETYPFVEAAGTAFQLTNILRDLGEDDARGRCYLPRDDVARFPSRPELLQFQIERARQLYEEAFALDRLLTNEGRAIFRVMHGTYRALLEKIATDPEAVFAKRVRVSRWRKAAIFLAAWPVKWGLR